MIQQLNIKIFLGGLIFFGGLQAGEKKMTPAAQEYEHYCQVRQCGDVYMSALDGIFRSNGWVEERYTDCQDGLVIPITSRMISNRENRGPVLKIFPDGAALETAWGRWQFVANCPMIDQGALEERLERVLELMPIGEHRFVVLKLANKDAIKPYATITTKGLTAAPERISKWRELTVKYNRQMDSWD